MPTTHTELLKQLSWRYAVKKFDASRKISPAIWHAIEQAVVLSPSSYGLQPWRFYVIDNSQVRTQLRAASWNQSQITDASHLVVFARREEVTPADVATYVERIAEVRGVAIETLNDYKGMMVGSVSSPQTLPGGSMETWTRSQVYIALGFFMASCAMLEVDACPMEGFDPREYDEVLGLPTQGYRAVVVATAGYRAADDTLAKAAKVRYSTQTLFKHV